MTSIASGSGYRQLTRADLTTFDREATDLILQAMKIGCLGRISSKGHAILRNNAGGTTSIPRNLTSQNRAAQNARADMRKFLARHRHEQPDERMLRIPEPVRRTTVTKAFSQYGADFARWLDTQPGGLPADAVIEVEIPDDGTPRFQVVSLPPTAQRTPDHTASRTETTVSSKPPVQTTPDPAPLEVDITADEVLQRIREVLGTDPQVAALQVRIAELEELLSAESERADSAVARLERIQQAFNA
jgi:hypothetical protein